MLGLDRCPECRGPLDFSGIQNKPVGVWRRWTYCPHDALFISTEHDGLMMQTTKRPPDAFLFTKTTFKGD